jgi:dephospho-CoA kinase
VASRPRPLRIALTGGIATGKSYVLARCASKGVPVVDADQLAHDAVAPGTPGLAAVAARFGPSVTKPDGSLDRNALGALVFADSSARRDLEAILHPLVYEAIEGWFRGLKAMAPFGIADIPLLFETNRAGDFDRVIVTACPPAMQIERLIGRGLTASDAAARLAAQWPIDEKVKRADDVIDTSRDFDATDRQVDRLIEVLGSLPPRACS